MSTNNSTSTFASYAFGHSENETRRLQAQSRLFNPATRRLLEDAGLAPGMRVLDVGSGAGDVAMLASDLVGPRGEVVGIDSNPLILETARKRAAAAGLENVTFIEGDITKAVPDGPFDAAVGRCVLFFVADQAAALRRIVDTVRPGGIVAFHEPGNASLRPDSRPPSPLLDRAWDWIIGGFEGAGLDTKMGLRVFSLFEEVGLPTPTMRLDAAVGGGPDWPGYDYIAETLRTILPLIVRHGVATEDEVGIDDFGARLRAEVVGNGGVITTWSFITAWARKP